MLLTLVVNSASLRARCARLNSSRPMGKRVKEGQMETQKAIEFLCRQIRPAGDEDWSAKASIIIEFAERVGAQLLEDAGFQRNSACWGTNQLAESFRIDDEEDHERLGDIRHTEGLWLLRLRSDLSHTEDDEPQVDHALYFCYGRVVELNWKTNSVMQVMSYEEAARFVVFWLAGKILEIIRKNQWDRVSRLPDLFDRLARLIAA